MSLLYDVIVIGGGSAGYAAARTAVAGGASVAVVEGGEKVGGLCILRGCMPTKALLESAHRLHEIHQAGEFGLQVKQGRADLHAILRRKDALIEEFASDRRKSLEHGPFKFIRGNASFLDAHTIEIKPATGAPLRIKGKAFIIATGSRVTRIPVPGLMEAGYITSDEAIRLKKLPRRLIVLGGGVVAVELAQYFSRLGSKVTILQRNKHLLKDNDPAVSSVLETSFRDEGIQVITETQLKQVRTQNGFKEVIFTCKGKKRTVRGDEIFYALGREPRTEGLALEKAGLLLAGGPVCVNLRMQSRVKHVFGAGDVTNLHEVVHIAVQQGEVAGTNAARIAKRGAPTAKMDYRLKAQVTFTHPEIASVGLNEKEATEKGIPYFAASYPFNDHGKSMIMGAKHGFVKLLVGVKRGEIIGGHVVGPHASDLIHEIIAVMQYRGTARQLAQMPHYHPTLAEIWTYPAEELADRVEKKKK